MAERVTMEDIAVASGVSISTISLVLRDRPGINTETRKRVIDVARKLGYLKKPLNEIETPRPLTNLGLIIRYRNDDLPQNNSFYSHVLAGIEVTCRKKRINLLYAAMPVDEENHPLELPRLLYDKAVEGLLLVGAFLDATLTEALKTKTAPLVLVDAYGFGSSYDAVESDNYQGAYEAVTYLIKQGHRHIGIVGSLPGGYPSIQERRRGYLQALEDNNIKTSYFGDSHCLKEEATRAALVLLKENPLVTAVFGCNDESAIGTIQAATMGGRHVPDDLSVIGFDDIDIAAHILPPLTTMQVDKVAMGRLAVQLLASRIEDPDSGSVTTLIRPKLVERASVKPLLQV